MECCQIQRVAIINRGEAAMRFLQAARTWSRLHGRRLETVAFYTDVDANAAFVQLATRAVPLGPALTPSPDGKLRSAYLDVERIVALCVDSGADAVWPGWGFLAESPEFASACAAVGIVFIGPSSQAMSLLGDKIRSKVLADELEVPASKWSKRAVEDVAEAEAKAVEIGFPLLLKASAGGGGRGIRIVHSQADIAAAFESATTEALSAFGNGALLMEQYISDARHIEVQVLADAHGTVWTLGTRDCSMQRRHQKVIEEAPASLLPNGVAEGMFKAASRLTKASEYVGAGTVEFLLSPTGDDFYFLEMNTRLQVEHTVTEMIYGVDLVHRQIEIACGEKLPGKEPPQPRGVAVEVRLNAENPDNGFAPSAGTIDRFDPPHGPNVRVDSGYAAQSVVPGEFDSNIAKIMAWGPDRSRALARLETALRDTVLAIDGGPNNCSLLLELVSSDEFISGGITTNWLGGYLKERPTGSRRAFFDIALCSAAIGDHLRKRRFSISNLLDDAHRGVPQRAPKPAPTKLRYLVDNGNGGNVTLNVEVATIAPSVYRVGLGDRSIAVHVEGTGRRTQTIEEPSGRRHGLIRVATSTHVFVQVNGVAHSFARASDGSCLAPIPAVVTDITVAAGQTVEAGQTLAVLEVMKMESPVRAAASGVVTEVCVEPQSRVAAGDVLVRLREKSGAGADDGRGADGARGEDAVNWPQAGNGDSTSPLVFGGAADFRRRVSDRVAAIEPSPVGILRQALLGYDLEKNEAKAALGRLTDGTAKASLDGLLELLAIYELQESFFVSGPTDDAVNDAGESSAEQLASFMRRLDLEQEDLSAAFVARVRTLFAYHEVRHCDRGFAFESALLRLFQARQTPRLRVEVLFAVVSAVLRVLGNGTVDGKTELPGGQLAPVAERRVLERLATSVVGEDRRLARAIWQVVYLLFDRPKEAAREDAQRRDATGIFETLSADAGVSETAIEDKARALPLKVLLAAGKHLSDQPAAVRERWLTLLARKLVFVGHDVEAKELRAVAIRGGIVFASNYREVGVALGELAEQGGSDILLGFEPDWQMVLERFAELPSGKPEITPITIIWHDPCGAIRLRTLVCTGAENADDFAWALTDVSDDSPADENCRWRELRLLRDIHPSWPTANYLRRFGAFELGRIETSTELFLAHARARDGSGDERLIVIVEIDHFDVEEDPGGGGVHLPSCEKAYVDAVFALSQALDDYGTKAMRAPGAKLGAPPPLVWNRITLFVRPKVDFSRRALGQVISRMSPWVAGLGLEKACVHATLGRQNEPSSRSVPIVVRWSDPTHRGPVMTVTAADDAPVAPHTAYEQRVVAARRRGKFFPYELIRALTASPQERGGFAHGEFEELDLPVGDEGGAFFDATIPALESVAQRPFGENRANLVVGIICNRRPRFPSGLRRVLIIGDPTRSMGALAAPECRRIIVAIDLAEREHLPVEWVPISSGARIAFDSGTENLDWTARVLRRIIEFTQAGGVINMIVDGVCVGAQSYWNAEATMLQHCRGTLVMTRKGCMLLTGKRALEFSGSVAAATNEGIGGLGRIMGPNGQAQYEAEDLADAYRMLFRHYDLTCPAPDSNWVGKAHSSDSPTRDCGQSDYKSPMGGFGTIAEIFSENDNPGKKRPFAIREVLSAVLDSDVEPLERWPLIVGGESAVVFHGQLGGWPVCCIGIESQPIKRRGQLSSDGPDSWSSGTLFPHSSRKVSRAINAASGVCPVVVLANLSGFDGSPESLRKRQLEFGAEIGRAVVNFDGPIIFCVIARYHGGAYVVFSRALSDTLSSFALDGAYASVIGGGPAAAVVFPRMVIERVKGDQRVIAAGDEVRAASTDAERVAAEERLQKMRQKVEIEKQAEVAREFDDVHSVARAQQVGSIERVIMPQKLREELCAALDAVAPPSAPAHCAAAAVVQMVGEGQR